MKRNKPRDGREPWNITPLWISPSDRRTIETYIFLKGVTRISYLSELITKDMPRLKREIDKMNKGE